MLTQISDRLCDRIDTLLESLEVDLFAIKNYYKGPCPIHGGDNPGAFVLYPDGDTRRGEWKCYTHQCHEHFADFSLIGLIKGVLSHKKFDWACCGDQEVPHREAVDYALRLIGTPIEDVKPDTDRDEQRNFISGMEVRTRATGESPPICGRDTVRHHIKIPAKYYIRRGYSARILNQFDVGLCDSRTHQMYMRVVVPIYNEDMMLIGYVGRSVYEECQTCALHHHPSAACPTTIKKILRSCKWMCKKDFNDKNHLYNYWRARPHIEKSRCAVIVEGAGDVWRLEEAGIRNSVAVLGSGLYSLQREKLQGCRTIIALTDNDLAGDGLANIIASKCRGMAEVVRLKPPPEFKDVGDMSVADVKEVIVPFIQSKEK